MNGEEILALMNEVFPPVDGMQLRIPELSEDAITLVWPVGDEHIRPGGTISGPAMMTIADTAAYFLVLANVGPEPLAVTTSLNINFLRKPAPGELIAEARKLKQGSRLFVCDVFIRTSASEELVAQASVTYSVPPATKKPTGRG